MAATPLQAAVGGAVLDVIEQEGLQERVADVGGYLKGELGGLAIDRCVGDVRGHGLFIGVDWVSDEAARTPDATAPNDSSNA